MLHKHPALILPPDDDQHGAMDLYQTPLDPHCPGDARTVVIASTGWLTGLWGPAQPVLDCIGSMTLGSRGTR